MDIEKNPYADIIHLPHHKAKNRPHMNMYDRAAQFSPFAALTGYGDSAIEYALRFWAANEHYWDAVFDVNVRIKKAFDASGIEMTYPHLNVHLDK